MNWSVVAAVAALLVVALAIVFVIAAALLELMNDPDRDHR